jgi:hypothetical protein
MKEKFQQQSGKMAMLQELPGTQFASCTELRVITSSIVRPYCAAQNYSRVARMWQNCENSALGGTGSFIILTGNVIKSTTGK